MRFLLFSHNSQCLESASGLILGRIFNPRCELLYAAYRNTIKVDMFSHGFMYNLFLFIYYVYLCIYVCTQESIGKKEVVNHAGICTFLHIIYARIIRLHFSNRVLKSLRTRMKHKRLLAYYCWWYWGHWSSWPNPIMANIRRSDVSNFITRKFINPVIFASGKIVWDDF